MRNSLASELHRRRINRAKLWLKQNEATVDTAGGSLESAEEKVSGTSNLSTARLRWPSRLPDLSACEVSQWGYLQSSLNTRKIMFTTGNKGSYSTRGSSRAAKRAAICNVKFR
ncbi:hypothetical protein PR048_014328 [Dryococelus australis]|uniref:Uncharacterized protein n=1 Tax=Dryococelus australis TaxID=614101 RepID=A0ABQ9HE54_9NEOP|nr:hypothetical protein PR048_014328 [Dryococelus australis]